MIQSLFSLHFSQEQLAYLYPSLGLLLCSLISYRAGRHQLSFFLLFLGAFGLRFFMIQLDPFLNEWDERYHALVAKSMMTNPFKPTLWPYHVLEYDYKEWAENHVWLHKQPLFLWQMGLSMKLFGVNEIAMRLPSAVMGAIQVLLLIRLGQLLHHQKVGYIAGFLFALNYFQLDETAGLQGREHNDVAFQFYFTASLWALAEYWKSNKRYWIPLIGLFSGMAVLIKWLFGLLVYAGWGLGLLTKKVNRWQFSSYLQIGLSFLVAILVFLPWQIYTAIRFPLESAHEFQYNGRHLFEVLEGHRGTWLYYFDWNYILYGKGSLWYIVPGLFWMLFKAQNHFLRYALLFCLVITYGFYTLAPSKGVAYVFVVSPVIVLAIGGIIFQAEEWLNWLLEKYIRSLPVKQIVQNLVFISIMIIAGIHSLRIWKIDQKHTFHPEMTKEQRENREKLIHNARIYKELDQLVPEEYVIFNCDDPISAMFYCNRIAYFWMGPDSHQELKERGINMAAFVDYRYPMPHYLKNDENTVVIDRIQK